MAGRYSSDGLPVWTASGRLPDGTEVVVSDAYLDADPSHAYAVLVRDGESRVVHGGEVDRFAVLPIVLRLPDGMGTVVARSQARLTWSSATTPWQEMGFGAALVPPDATRVRVTLRARRCTSSTCPASANALTPSRQDRHDRGAADRDRDP